MSLYSKSIYNLYSSFIRLPALLHTYAAAVLYFATKGSRWYIVDGGAIGPKATQSALVVGLDDVLTLSFSPVLLVEGTPTFLESLFDFEDGWLRRIVTESTAGNDMPWLSFSSSRFFLLRGGGGDVVGRSHAALTTTSSWSYATGRGQLSCRTTTGLCLSIFSLLVDDNTLSGDDARMGRFRRESLLTRRLLGQVLFVATREHVASHDDQRFFCCCLVWESRSFLANISLVASLCSHVRRAVSATTPTTLQLTSGAISKSDKRVDRKDCRVDIVPFFGGGGGLIQFLWTQKLRETLIQRK